MKKSKKTTLSVVLATFNEEANIKACLKSVKGLADEIIVVDGSSTDKTRSIAKKISAQVFKVKNQAIFHINKNKAIKKAKSDWVLQLDADERVTPALAREIKKVLAGNYFGYSNWQSTQTYTAPNPPTGFWLKRRNLFLGHYFKKSGQYPDPVIRLFKRGKGVLPALDVHEQVTIQGPVSWLKEDLDHQATPTFSQYLKRENRYSSLQAKLLQDQGIAINVLSFLNFMFFQPFKTFFLIYFRHLGFRDGFPGFVFALFSAIHHQLAFMKLWELSKNRRHLDLSLDWN